MSLQEKGGKWPGGHNDYSPQRKLDYCPRKFKWGRRGEEARTTAKREKAGGILGSGQQDRQESEWNCNQPTLHLIIRLLDYISTPSSASQFHRFALVWPVRWLLSILPWLWIHFHLPQEQLVSSEYCFIVRLIVNLGLTNLSWGPFIEIHHTARFKQTNQSRPQAHSRYS